eukprot:gene4773-34531_t
MYGRKQSKRKGGIFTSSTESNIPHMQPALARPGHQPPLGRTPAGETHRVATQHVDHPDDLWYDDEDDDDDDPCSSPVAGTSDSLPRQTRNVDWKEKQTRTDEAWRDQLVVEGIILDMRRLHQSRLPLGEAGKDSRNLTKQRMRAGKCLKSKLEELYIWEGFERDVTIDSLRRTDATIKQWIAGTDPDWVVQDSTLVSAKDLHHGRLWHEVTEDVKRCEEQIGMAWLLERHLARYNALLGQMQELIHIA